MTDLVEWLPACYDRAEQALRSPKEWERPHGAGCAITADNWPACDCDHADRLLADIDRKRLIFAEHEPEEVGPGRLRCSVCADPPQYDATWREWPCLTVRLLAAEFAGEPGYDESWRP